LEKRWRVSVQRKLTITVDEDVYEGLQKVAGRRKIGRFLQDLARPLVVRSKLESTYKAMAADRAREAEALDWAEATCGDINNAMADQLTTVSKRRLSEKEGTLSGEDMRRVAEAVHTQLDL
jgi:mRNA-degrading endonuclease toxin of MazEF toxin-antitoxin module